MPGCAVSPHTLKTGISMDDSKEKAPNSKKGLHTGHRQRVRDKYISSGIESFNDVQLLELILFYGYKRADTNETAHVLYNSFNKSLPLLFESNAAEISQKGGVNPNASALLSSLFHISGRYSKSRYNERMSLRNFYDIGMYAISLFAGETEEFFYLICLDKNYRLLQSARIPKRFEHSQYSYLQSDIVENAVKFNASYVVIANNRLSGELEFTDINIKTANAVTKALKTIGVDVIGHIIVSREKYVSFYLH